MIRKTAAFLLCALALALTAGAALAQENYEMPTWVGIFTSMTGAKTTPECFTVPGTSRWSLEARKSDDKGVSYIGFNLKFTPGADFLMDYPEEREFKAGVQAEVEIPENVSDIRGTGDYARGLSGAPFDVAASDGGTFSGKIGRVYSQQELVEQKCVPGIELIGYPDVTAVKVSMVTSPDFSAAAKYSERNNVALIRRVTINTDTAIYRIYLNKNYGTGETLEATASVADALVIDENGEWVPIPGGLESIPADKITYIRVEWRFSDMSGGESVNCEDIVSHSWQFDIYHNTYGGVDIYSWFTAKSKLFNGKTTRESYTNPAITGDWLFENETGENVKSVSHTLTFNAASKVYLRPEDEGPISVAAGETRTFDRNTDAERYYFYTYFDIYNNPTDDEDEQTAISRAPFTANVDGETISGRFGVMHSVREMVNSKCVPSIELIGDDKEITAIKWAFVRSPDFAAPVKRSAENDVAMLRRFTFRTRSATGYPRYRCFVNKTFEDGEELSGELVIADVERMRVQRSPESAWEAVPMTSIPRNLKSGEILYSYSDGLVETDRDDIWMWTMHRWLFTDEKLAPAVAVNPDDVMIPAPADDAIDSAECTGTNADIPDDLDGENIAPSESGETNTISEVIATVTIKVEYDKDKIGDGSEIDVVIEGDFSNFADKLSDLFALIQNNNDKKYHKFPIISANNFGLRFRLPVKGFFSEKNITIAEVNASSKPGPSPDPEPAPKTGSSSGCSAGALALSGLAAFAVIARKRKSHF